MTRPVLVSPASPASPAVLVAWLAAASLLYRQRSTVLRCLVLADVSPVPQNVLLLGPPGTAKTAIVTAYARANGYRTLARTLSAWTDDAALLGPVDVAALASGILRRVSGRTTADAEKDAVLVEAIAAEKKLDPLVVAAILSQLRPAATAVGAPTLTDAELGFFDELPRAGRGVRDLVLSALADRLTPDGVAVPAHVLAAAANTRLVDDDDRALVDRFALRVDVPRVTGPDLRSVIGRAVPIDGVAPVAAPLPLLPAGLIPALRARAAVCAMPSAVLDAVAACAAALRQPAPSGQTHPDVSERRWILATRLLQAAAVLDDRDAVAFDDLLSTLPFVLDDGEESRAAIRNAITSSIPPYVSALADLRAACASAVDLARRVEVERAPVSPATAQQHARREESLQALAVAMSEHGDDARKTADSLVAAALDACDDAVTEGVAARRRR